MSDGGSERGHRLAPWWAERPIGDPQDDLFDRYPFARRVADILNQQIATRPDPSVLALIGPWGSGKSSTVELILTGVNLDLWNVAAVNPWAVSTPDAVIAEVLGAVTASFDKQVEVAKAMQRLTAVARRVNPFLKFAGSVGAGASAVLDAMLAATSGDDKPLDEVLSETADAISDSTAKPVLVIVDDVDRLHSEELLALFKAVRVLGRLPKVHYLLAYDETTLLDVLSATEIARTPGRALAFLDKVITLRLDQPPSRRERLEAEFRLELAEVVEGAGFRFDAELRDRLAVENEFLFASALTEPRTLRRFVNQLRVYLPLLGGEVDIVDFTILTWLRTARPDLYRQVAADRRWLCGDVVDATAADRWRHLIGLDVRDVRSGSASAEQNRAGLEPKLCELLVRLFPHLDSLGTDDDGDDADRVDGVVTETALVAGGSAHLDEVQWRLLRGKRVASPVYCERYFALTTLSGQVDDSTIACAFSHWIANRDGCGDEGESAVRDVRAAVVDASDEVGAVNVLRRAYRHATELSTDEADGALRHVFALASDIATARALIVDEAVQLVGLLIRLGSPPNVADLQHSLDDAAGGQLDVDRQFLWSRGLRAALRRDGASDIAAGEAGWQRLNRLADHSAEAAVTGLLANAGRGDQAPVIETDAVDILTWAVERLNRAPVEARVRGALDGGTVKVVDLAARFVRSSALDEADGRFHVAGFIALVELERVESAEELHTFPWPRGDRPDLHGPQGGRGRRTQGWEWRRERAVFELELRLAELSAPTLQVVPPLPSSLQLALQNYQPHLELTQAPPLTVRVTIAGPTNRPNRFDLVELDVLSFERRAEALFNDLPLRDPARQGAWELRDARMHDIGAVNTADLGAMFGGSTVNIETAAHLGFRSISGPRDPNRSDSLPPAVLSVAAAVTAKPDSAEGSMLQLDELHHLVTALLGSINYFNQALHAFTASDDEVESVACAVVLTPAVDISEIVDLTADRRAGGASYGETRWSGRLYTDQHQRSTTGVTTSVAAARALETWLVAYRWRGFQDELVQIARRRRE